MIKIEFGADVTALHGGDDLEAVTIRNAKAGATRVVDSSALFIMWARRLLGRRGISRTLNGLRVLQPYNPASV
jgi:hypothetical protein